MVRSLPEWRSKYVHLTMRRGRKIAKVAMAGKLAVRLYWMMRKGWDYQQVKKFGSHAGQPGNRDGVFTGEFEVTIMIAVVAEEMHGRTASSWPATTPRLSLTCPHVAPTIARLYDWPIPLRRKRVLKRSRRIG
jgi:hypothetical protein